MRRRKANCFWASTLWTLLVDLGLTAAAAAQSYTVIHSFNGTDGDAPFAGLVQGADGNLYGTTAGGGAGNYGTVFKIDTASNLTTLHSFTGASGDGLGPTGGLIQGTDGNFYGTTYGFQSAFGTVFMIDPSGNLATLHPFSGSPDGAHPYAGLV